MYCSKEILRNSGHGSQQELLLSTINISILFTFEHYYSSSIVSHATCFIQEELGMCQLLLKYQYA